MGVRKSRIVSGLFVPLFAVGCVASSSMATVQFNWAVIGDVGNAADSTGFGSVSYRFSMATTEVTNAQYAEFLNAKARTDSHGLYNENMAGPHGGIERSGSAGAYTYTVRGGREGHPVNFVSFMDSMRFVNWLQNGQGDGDTESGTYAVANGLVEARAAGDRFVLPSENEWYKAAYYRGGGTHAGYWAYGNSSDTADSAMANLANAHGGTTMVGSFSANALGVFDMAGNLSEWNEAMIDSQSRGIRGGSWSADASFAAATTRAMFPDDPGKENADVGFRVAFVPAPGAGVVLLAAFASTGRRRSR